jgi:hypothetical protein
MLMLMLDIKTDVAKTFKTNVLYFFQKLCHLQIFFEPMFLKNFFEIEILDVFKIYFQTYASTGLEDIVWKKFRECLNLHF